MPYRKSHRCPDGRSCSHCAPYGQRQKRRHDLTAMDAAREIGSRIEGRPMPNRNGGDRYTPKPTDAAPQTPEGPTDA